MNSVTFVTATLAFLAAVWKGTGREFGRKTRHDGAREKGAFCHSFLRVWNPLPFQIPATQARATLYLERYMGIYLTKKTGAICEFFGMLATITIFNPCIAKVNNVNGNMSCCGKNPRLLSFKWNSFRVVFHIDSFSVIILENPSRDFFLCFAFLEMKGFRPQS